MHVADFARTSHSRKRDPLAGDSGTEKANCRRRRRPGFGVTRSCSCQLPCQRSNGSCRMSCCVCVTNRGGSVSGPGEGIFISMRAAIPKQRSFSQIILYRSHKCAHFIRRFAQLQLVSPASSFIHTSFTTIPCASSLPHHFQYPRPPQYSIHINAITRSHSIANTSLSYRTRGAISPPIRSLPSHPHPIKTTQYASQQTTTRPRRLTPPRHINHPRFGSAAASSKTQKCFFPTYVGVPRNA